jgi:hypothetical protein
MKVIGIFFFLYSFTFSLWAQEVIPGLIPRFYSIEAATDLGESPELLHSKAMNGVDISFIDPDKTSNIWSPHQHQIPAHQLVNTGEAVKYQRDLPGRSGVLRFTIMDKKGQEFVVMVSKKIHNILLRRNILAKLGYSTQPMTWVPKINLDFKNSIDKDLFKEKLKDSLLGNNDRWIVDESKLEIVLQDVLVMATEANIYNLSLGLMPERIHQGRRVLRAPYIPLALVDTPESVNLMPWSSGRIVLNNIKLNHTQELDTSFDTSWEDARWIGRRLAKLTRNDFEEIVKKAKFPAAVEAILIEKIISRRNDLLKLLKLSDYSEITFNPEISFGADLINGEIVTEFFEGYSSRFSYGDPESPFSASELGYFALSRVQSQLIGTAISKLNSVLGSQDEKNFANKILDIVNEKGPFFPLQAVFIPTIHGGFTLSRDIVTGFYMGTNNKVQVVDNFGVNLDLGGYGSLEGGAIALGVKGGPGVSFQRVYSHVKPLETLKKSIKEPYKNMIVPLVIKDLSDKINKISTVSIEDQTVMLGSIINELKTSIGVGESFIITDSLVPNFNIQQGLSISQFFFMDPNLLKIHTQAQLQKIGMSRYHFHRLNEDTFQIYQDVANGRKISLTLRLKSYVPIISFNVRSNKFTAKTNFFSFKLTPTTTSVEMLKSLRRSLLIQQNDNLSELVRPHQIDQDVKGKGNTLGLFVFSRNRIKNDQFFKIQHAKGGQKKTIERRYDSITSGTDVESYLTQTINNLLSIFTKTDLSLSSFQSSNPGFSVGGRAQNKIFTSEWDGERLTTSFQRILNGWRARPRRLKGMLDIMNNEIGQELVHRLDLQNTNSILLYQLSYNYTLTHEGILALLGTTGNRLKANLIKHSSSSFEEDEKQRIVDGLILGLQDIQKNLTNNSLSGMKKLHMWLKKYQDISTIMGLADLVGKSNIATQARVGGFRQGDEGGDAEIFGDVFGELPLALHAPPTQKVMSKLGIIEGELMLNWVVERAL